MKERELLVEEYEINPFTMMIQPIKYGNKTYSKIYEVNNSLISPFKPLDIVKKGCEYFGSSFEGRREGTRKLTQITHKSPIAIDPTNQIYLFPTTSPTGKKCYWISHTHIATYSGIDNRNTSVTFKNKRIETIPMSVTSFSNQIQRTSLLQVKLTTRLEEARYKAKLYWQQPVNARASEQQINYKFNGFNH